MQWVKNIPLEFVRNKKITNDYRMFKNLFNISPLFYL